MKLLLLVVILAIVSSCDKEPDYLYPQMFTVNIKLVDKDGNNLVEYYDEMETDIDCQVDKIAYRGDEEFQLGRDNSYIFMDESDRTEYVSFANLTEEFDSSSVPCVKFTCYWASDESNCYDRSVLEVVSSDIFADEETHTIEVLWDTDSSYSNCKITAVSIDGVDYPLLNHGLWSLNVTYVRPE